MLPIKRTRAGIQLTQAAQVVLGAWRATLVMPGASPWVPQVSPTYRVSTPKYPLSTAGRSADASLVRVHDRCKRSTP